MDEGAVAGVHLLRQNGRSVGTAAKHIKPPTGVRGVTTATATAVCGCAIRGVTSGLEECGGGLLLLLLLLGRWGQSMPLHLPITPPRRRRFQLVVRTLCADRGGRGGGGVVEEAGQGGRGHEITVGGSSAQ